MPWSDDERIMISALEHYVYCPRQCALIHVEQTYEENVFTLRGNRAHERVDEAAAEERAGVRVERALPLYSDRLGLVGRADVVEFHGGVPYPIEYKHGTKRHHRPARIQLGAQALCLEEMTGRPRSLRRTLSYQRPPAARGRSSTDALRTSASNADGARSPCDACWKPRRVPPPVNDDRCPPCSLQARVHAQIYRQPAAPDVVGRPALLSFSDD